MFYDSFDNYDIVFKWLYCNGWTEVVIQIPHSSAGWVSISGCRTSASWMQAPQSRVPGPWKPWNPGTFSGLQSWVDFYAACAMKKIEWSPEQFQLAMTGL